MDGRQIINNYNTLKGARAKLDSEIEQASALCNPAKYGSSYHVRTSSQSGADSKSVEVVSDYAQMAATKYIRGFFFNLFPANVRWFGYGANAIGTGEKIPESVRRYLANASQVAYDLIYSTNFPVEMLEVVEDSVDAGTTVISCEFSPKTILKFRTHRLGKIVAQRSADDEIDTIYEDLQLSATQVVNIFNRPDDTIPEKIRTSAASGNVAQSDCTCRIIHYVGPKERAFDIRKEGNDFKTVPAAGFEGKAFESIYVEVDSATIIRREGFDHNPYIVGRIDNCAAGDVYGLSPALRALRTMKLHNKLTAATVNATESVLKPSVMLDLGAYTNLVSEFFFEPGSVNFYNSQGGKYNAPQFYAPPANFAAGGNLDVRLQQIIDHFFSADLFTLLQQMELNSGRQRTAREIIELVNERNSQILTTVSRFLDETVSPLLKLVFYLLLENTSVFGPPPPELGEILANGVNLQYFSPLAMAARATRINGTLAAIEDLAQMLQIFPEALDVLDKDAFIRDLFEVRGALPSHLLEERKIKELRETRAKMQQQQAMTNQAVQLGARQNLNQRPEVGSIMGSLLGGNNG